MRQHGADALLGDHAQQPADVVACCAQHGMQPVTRLPFEVAAVHAVIGFEMPDDGLDGLTPPQQPSLLLADPLGLAETPCPSTVCSGERG